MWWRCQSYDVAVAGILSERTPRAEYHAVAETIHALDRLEAPA